ncbi:MAG: beta-ketoacyl-ACP reductase [Planctomycetaceae bacterium]|nr:beta-ketoacyl-ACP reductase [Planctomycetaceae bacterium]
MVGIDLTGKTAIITGAGRGLGLATAQRLYAAGANVAINEYDDPSGENHTQAEQAATDLGDRAAVVMADVRDTDAIEVMVDNVAARFGGLDIVVNNAAILRDRTLKKMSATEWQSVIDTNLTGVFNVCKAGTAAMRDGGRIVNLASISAVIGFFGQTNYAAAKAGVIGLTRSLSREVGARQITVNAVAPGVALTDMGLTIPENVREEMLKSIPLGRFAEPREIADVIVFLCSDLASHVSGQVIHVNGGWWG